MEQIGSEERPVMFRKAIVSKESRYRKGFNKKIVNQVAHLLKNAEFKRFQAPPLLKISNQAFGSGWKKPIASR